MGEEGRHIDFCSEAGDSAFTPPQLHSTNHDGPAERALRARIYRAEIASHSRACDFQSFDAGHISHIASGIAASWVFKRPATRDQLEQVVEILTWLFLAAGALEQLEGLDGD